MVYGYMGRSLEVDLTKEEIKIVDLNEEWARMFIGGKGLGAQLLYESVEPGLDPLAAENPLIFITGPLTATSASTSGRWAVVTKSPHTGIFLDSQVGGHFGARLKMAGFDYFTVRGTAYQRWPMPNPGCPRAMGKRSLRNREGPSETTPRGKGRLHRSSGREPGELRLYLFRSLPPGRTGWGGGSDGLQEPEGGRGSKNLKAVVAEGGYRTSYANPEGFAAKVKSLRKLISDHPGMSERREIGTPLWVAKANHAGFLPTRNFSSGVFELANEISGETMRRKIVVKNSACYGCPILCGKENSAGWMRASTKGSKLRGRSMRPSPSWARTAASGPSRPSPTPTCSATIWAWTRSPLEMLSASPWNVIKRNS